MSPFRCLGLSVLALPILVLQLQGAAASTADPAPRGAARITFACGPGAPCRAQAGSGPNDRAVHPFEGTLGRPCSYRWRATPEGTRKVRVCF